MKIDPKEYDTITAAAVAVGSVRTTLRDGVARGEVSYVETPSGVKLINLKDAARWRGEASTRRTGPRPKDESGLFDD